MICREDKEKNLAKVTHTLLMQIEAQLANTQTVLLTVDAHKRKSSTPPPFPDGAPVRKSEYDYETAAADARAYIAELGKLKDRVKELGHVPYEPTKTGIHRSIDDAVAICETVFRNGKIDVNTPPCDHEIYFLGDKLRIQTVLINILLNMAEVLSDCPEREIDVEVHDYRKGPMPRDELMLVLRNSGPCYAGDPEEMFDLDEKDPKGLPISRDIVENRFGGRMYASNLDRGIEFYIELPIERE